MDTTSRCSCIDCLPKWLLGCPAKAMVFDRVCSNRTVVVCFVGELLDGLIGEPMKQS